MHSTELRHIREQFRALLLDGIAPFWLHNGIDWGCGGVFSCMDEYGKVLSTDKFIWSQARSVWTFSALYNRVERRPEFLRAAANSVRFLLAHGLDGEGRWLYRTDRNGKPIEGPISIYSDLFAVYGFSEYYRATGDAEVLAVATASYQQALKRIVSPGFSETAPYPLPPGRRAHGVSMMLTEVTNELLATTGNPELEEVLTRSVDEIMDRFLRERHGFVVEFLNDAWDELPAPEGTAVMPGHAIESMWFVLHVARRRGDGALAARAIQAIRRHLEAGWDSEYGGIFLGIDADGCAPFVRNAEKKPWWPQTEALYALLLAWKMTGEPWCMDWYRRVHEWGFAHYPIPEVGEWRQRLLRDGSPTTEVIGLPAKDPFHLPRTAILIGQLLAED